MIENTPITSNFSHVAVKSLTAGFFFALFLVTLVAPAPQMVYVRFQFEVVLCRIIDMQKTQQPSQQRSAMSFAISFYKMVCGRDSPFLSIVFAYFISIF